MTIDVTVVSIGGVEVPDLGAQRGHRREGGRGSGCSTSCIEVDGRPLSPLGLRRRGVRDPDRLHRVRVLGGRARWSGPTSRRCCWSRSSAHALFAGPMVVSPQSVLAAEVEVPRGPGRGFRASCGAMGGAWSTCRRVLGSRSTRRAASAAAGCAPARRPCIGAPFTDRLVAKFGLPVSGWRGGRLGGDSRGRTRAHGGRPRD